MKEVSLITTSKYSYKTFHNFIVYIQVSLVCHAEEEFCGYKGGFYLLFMLFLEEILGISMMCEIIRKYFVFDPE